MVPFLMSTIRVEEMIRDYKFYFRCEVKHVRIASANEMGKLCVKCNSSFIVKGYEKTVDAIARRLWRGARFLIRVGSQNAVNYCSDIFITGGSRNAAQWAVEYGSRPYRARVLLKRRS